MKLKFLLCFALCIALRGTIFAAAPTISSFSPSTGAVGKPVTITGTNLDSATLITIGGANALILSNTSTKLVAMVMPGAVTGSVAITTTGGTATGSGNFTVTDTPVPTTQQGPKLAAASGGFLDGGLAISADGNTAVVGSGGTGLSNGLSVFTRTGNVWNPQGHRLYGTGGYDLMGNQGSSIAISADGNTIIESSPTDNHNQGAMWTFTRTGSTWTQLGAKVPGGGEAGSSLSISADGNTAVAGAPYLNGQAGGVFVYTRSGGVWDTPHLLFGTGAIGTAFQGSAVRISADGNTVIEGGVTDNGGVGAVWIFIRSGSTWVQQGNKIVAPNGAGYQGWSVALSADGNTAIWGALEANTFGGAVWVYTRTAGVWTQQGGQLIGAGTGIFEEQSRVALSADGNTAIVGATGDNNVQGAVFVYKRTAGTWTQQGPKLTTPNMGGFYKQFGSNLVLSADGTTALVAAPGDNLNAGSLTPFGISVSSASTPVISSFSPSTGAIGTLVTVNGSNLSNFTAFYIGGQPAVVISNTGSQLIGMVMPGSITGQVLVAGAGGTFTTSSNFTVKPTLYADQQQGAKLAGTASVDTSMQGRSVAISSDGNTAVVGAPGDSNGTGAIWIYTRANNIWTQQGDKLTGTGGVGVGIHQGTSVAISADGNTIIEGAPGDNSYKGAEWIFTRTGTTWAQQGNKLTGTANTGAAQEGTAVAISADGNTAAAGGPYDNGKIGAVWAYVRSGSIWAQQANKMVGGENTGASMQGGAIAISADGNLIIAGGSGDNSGQGAVWFFFRYGSDGSMWPSGGDKLTVTDNIGAAGFGGSVAFSADGSTAIAGGSGDNNSTGATWEMFRTDGSWNVRGSKVTATGTTGMARLGSSVALSADGLTALIGAAADNSSQGAVFSFTRLPTTSFSTPFIQQGAKLTGTGNTGPAALGASVALSTDGHTAIAGGPADNTSTGAAWIFTDNGIVTLSNLTLSAGTLSPAFAASTTAYQAYVSPTTASITLTPTADNSNATIAVNGIAVTSGTPSTPIALASGANTINTVITSADGSPAKTYTVTVTRLTALSANLANLHLSNGTLAPAFVANTLSYTASVANSVTSITVSPTLRDTLASVTVNGVGVANRTPSQPIALSTGDNVITIIVIAEDGVTTRTYTTTVTRAPTPLTFNTLPTQSYGNADFSPGATSTDSITYTSSNTAVAVIVNGNIHITGFGIANITATNGSTTKVQKLTVSRAVVTITANNLSKVPGAANPTLILTYTGLAYGETNAVFTTQPTVKTTATTASGMGHYPISVSGAVAANYSFVYVQGVLTVSTAAITFNPIPVQTYGNANFGPGATSNVAVTYSSSNTAVATIVFGNIHITGAGTSTITATNGTVTQTQILTVNPAPLTITADDQSKPTGAANPALTASYSGFVYGDTPASLDSLPVITTTAVTTSPAGAYPITASHAVDPNYNITYVAGTLTVSATAITFNALPAQVYGNADFSPGATSNFPITYSSNHTNVATIVNGNIHITGFGTCNITASNGSTNVVQKLSVSRAPLTITADNKTKVAGTANPTLTASYSGFVYGETSSVLTTQPRLYTTATTSYPPGHYSITASGAAAANYAITYANGVLTITAAGGALYLPNSPLFTDNNKAEPQVNPAVSPNGDGLNDVLKIDNIEAYPDNRLVIIDKGGAKVYEAIGYDNNGRAFDGHSSLNRARQQPGTYYYILDYKKNGVTQHKTGYIVLKY